MKTAYPVQFDPSNQLEQTKIQYQRRFGVIAGYLPRDIAHIGNWLSNLVEASQKTPIKQFTVVNRC